MTRGYAAAGEASRRSHGADPVLILMGGGLGWWRDGSSWTATMATRGAGELGLREEGNEGGRVLGAGSSRIRPTQAAAERRVGTAKAEERAQWVTGGTGQVRVFQIFPFPFSFLPLIELKADLRSSKNFEKLQGGPRDYVDQFLFWTLGQI